MKKDTFRFIATSIAKCCIAFTVALYISLLGVSLANLLIDGVFYFDFRGNLTISMQKGLFFGVIYGVGNWLMRKAKKFEGEK